MESYPIIRLRHLKMNEQIDLLESGKERNEMKRKYGRIGILIMALMLTLSSQAFAAQFPDIQSGTPLENAAAVVSALDVMKPFEDGTFRPEQAMTRAEFMKVVVLVNGLGEVAALENSSKYSDVPAGSEDAGYIMVASNLGLVEGYEDGTFRPEEEILYEQAVKIVIRMLNYDQHLDEKTAYPFGYLALAEQLRISKNVNGTVGKAVTRGQVALLVYNSLNVPIMTII